MAMQLRSGRRLASPAPAPRGDLRRVRPRRSQDGDDDNGKDRISSLPKDMRLEVLARLGSTREAIRTSVLSEPWRRLWTELRELTFDDVAAFNPLLSALAKVQPMLDRLCITIPSENMMLGGMSISRLLRAANKLEPLELVVTLSREYRSRAFVLPCFARATSIELRIASLLFKLPPTGSFASLEQLTMLGASFIDPGVLLPRCPRLHKLWMDGRCPGGVTALAVESSSLVELTWHLLGIKEPVDVHVVAPNLKSFVFSSCSRKFTMSLSAPKLEELCCKYYLEDSTVGCVENVRWRLYLLRLDMGPGMGMEWSESHRDGRRKHVLSLSIDNVMVTPPVERSFQQEVARLPVTLTHLSALELNLRSDGHVFGSLVLQLLRIRTDIHRLKVSLLQGTECWEHCGCDFASNWRNELISLPRLEVAEFEGFRGDDHEMDFLKLLFGSAPSLKTVSVHHFNEGSIVKASCQKLHSMFPANAPVSFFFHQFHGSSSAIARSVVNLCLSG